MKKLIFTLLIVGFVGCSDTKPAPPPSQQIVQGTSMIKPIKKYVVYDFGATWCPPCRAFVPTFESWKKKYSSATVEFQKIDSDENPELTAQFHISSLPTIIVVRDGQEIKRWVGVPKEADVVQYLNK